MDVVVVLSAPPVVVLKWQATVAMAGSHFWGVTPSFSTGVLDIEISGCSLCTASASAINRSARDSRRACVCVCVCARWHWQPALPFPPQVLHRVSPLVMGFFPFLFQLTAYKLPFHSRWIYCGLCWIPVEWHLQHCLALPCHIKLINLSVK